jgi:hypothetical protein
MFQDRDNSICEIHHSVNSKAANYMAHKASLFLSTGQFDEIKSYPNPDLTAFDKAELNKLKYIYFPIKDRNMWSLLIIDRDERKL